VAASEGDETLDVVGIVIHAGRGAF